MKMLPALFILLTLYHAGRCHADDSAGAVISLADLPGVAIVVEPVAKDLEDAGMTGFVFSVEIERRLKEAGVRVLNPEYDDPVEGNPTLYLVVTAVVDEYVEYCAYSIRLELTQTVRLERNPDVTVVGAPTWSTGGVGVHGKGWRQVLHDDVGAYTDRFIGAFAAANPNARVGHHVGD
jgi:hypothetical protein